MKKIIVLLISVVILLLLVLSTQPTEPKVLENSERVKLHKISVFRSDPWLPIAQFEKYRKPFNENYIKIQAEEIE